ncbi:MAG: ABC transporter permease [Candidatus Aenigmatarchaeota archaeon]
MHLREFLILVYENLFTNKLRFFLTMIGIVVGTAALILVFAIGKGGEALVIKEVENFGSNLIIVYLMYGKSRESLTLEDNENISKLPDVLSCAPVNYHSLLAKRGKVVKYLWIMGTTPDYAKVRNSEIISGRFITEEDVKKEI